VVSADGFNQGPADLVIVCPITKVSRSIPSHVAIRGSDSGLDQDSFIISEQVRCISRERLHRPIGKAPRDVLDRVSTFLRVLLDL